MEPLRGGSLINRLPFEARQVFKRSGDKRSRAEWALRWIWDHTGVSTILSGMSQIDQLKENVDLAYTVSENPLTEEDNLLINEVRDTINNLQKVSCTACGYCTPCPEGVNIPRNFALYNDHYMFSDPAAKGRYQAFLSDQEKASNCIQCGICLEKCPQQIAIPDELAKVRDLFG